SVGLSSAAPLAPAAPAEVPARSVGTAPAAAYRVSPLFGRRNSVVRTGDSLVPAGPRRRVRRPRLCRARFGHRTLLSRPSRSAVRIGQSYESGRRGTSRTATVPPPSRACHWIEPARSADTRVLTI